MQKTEEHLYQIKKMEAEETNIQIIFQSENKGFSVLGCDKESSGIERELQHKTLFFVLRGSLIIADKKMHSWSLQKGEYILLPKGMMVRLHINPDTRYIDMKADQLVSPERELCEHQVHKYDDFIPVKGTGIVNRTILAGSHSVFMTMLLSKDAGPIQYTLPGKSMLFVLEGRGEIFYKKQRHQIFEGQKRSLAKGGHFMVKAKDGLKAVLLITLA